MEIYSKIDSDRFGIKVGKIRESFFDNKTVENGIDYFMRNGFDVIFARIDFSRLDIINGLEKYGFRLKDTQYTLYNILKDKMGNNLFDPSIFPKRNDGYVIRKFKPSDTEMIVDLTRESFSNHGHYFTDTRLNPQDGLDAYADWAYNSCINKNIATKIFVAEKDGDVAGYIAYKEFSQENKKYAAGVIGAVSSEHRGKGLFPDIDIAALEWGVENGYEWEEHNVLCDNYAVFRSHLKVGFKPAKFMVTLHGWLDEIKL